MKLTLPNCFLDALFSASDEIHRYTVRKGRSEGGFSKAALTQSETNSYYQLRVSFLRKLLRRNPRWLGGHLQFGLCELERNLAIDGAKHPRSIAAISLSAMAVKCLSRDNPESEEYASASYLEGMCSFLQGDYEKTLARFETLLEKPVPLQEKTRNRLLEYAAAASLSLGASDAAKKFLEQIPTEQRNAEVISGLGYLEEFGSTSK
jgi:tetratricopeptide (TPR) repeat protein